MRFTLNTGVVQVRHRYCWTFVFLCSLGCIYFLFRGDSKSYPRIYVITPTHERLTQKANLVHVMVVLRSVVNVFWIIVEDSSEKSQWLQTFLADSKIR